MSTEYTTQPCNKCKAEKPLTEYHRRGTSYQRICKSCRKAHIASGAKKIIRLNPPSLYPELEKRICSLERRLRNKAASYSRNQMEADDIYSAMIEEILFKSSPEDSDAKILTRAGWVAKRCLRQYATYAMLVEDESSISNDDGDGDTEIIASPTFSAEDELIDREKKYELAKLVSTLSEEHQVIVRKLMIGYNQHEIAIELGKADQTISYAIRVIANQLGFNNFAAVLS
ncbi:MAG: sigma-70 family RNA polymerase sigma factor [Chloracidobacterium sp.]|nr:sigma-70 family RNA polymerase sigma factor [Chloracidobacterium sp.]